MQIDLKEDIFSELYISTALPKALLFVILKVFNKIDASICKIVDQFMNVRNKACIRREKKVIFVPKHTLLGKRMSGRAWLAFRTLDHNSSAARFSSWLWSFLAQNLS